MIDIQDTKKLSHFLAQSLKEKGVKQSELLEIISIFHGFKDWNSMSSLKPEKDINLLRWTKIYHIHKDNGGLSLSYNPFQQILKLGTGFFGYSEHTINIPMKMSELKILAQALNSLLVMEPEVKCFEITENLKIEDYSLKYETMDCQFSYSLTDSEIIETQACLKKIIEIAKQLKDFTVNKLTVALKDSPEKIIGNVQYLTQEYRQYKGYYECSIDNKYQYDISMVKFFQNGKEVDIYNILDLKIK